MDKARSGGISVGTFFLGVFFLVLGVLMLVSAAGVLDLRFEKIIAFSMLAVGSYESVSAFAFSRRSRLLWGSSLFLAGLLILLISYDFIPGSWDQIWPTVLIIPGLSFLMLYFSSSKEYRLLVIAALLVGAGCLGLTFARENYGYADFLSGALRLALPVAIVFAGFYMMWKDFSKKRTL
jgi:hypothetical protein